jgi:fructose-1,6-bisphosphatase/inositol monophosphatase family enzyme
MQPLVELATHAASEASKLLKSQYRQDAAGTTSAVGKDIKTQADVAAEQLMCYCKVIMPCGSSIHLTEL